MQRSPARKARHVGVGAAGELGPVLSPLVPVPIRVHHRSAFSRYLASMHRHRTPLFTSLASDVRVDGNSRSGDTASPNSQRKGSKGWLAEIARNCNFFTKLLLLFIGMVFAVDAYKLVVSASGGLHRGSAEVWGGSAAPSLLQRLRVTTGQPVSEQVSLDSPGLFTHVQRAQSAVAGDAAAGEVLGAGGAEHNAQMRVVIDDIIAAASSERDAAAEARRKKAAERVANERAAKERAAEKATSRRSEKPEDAPLDLRLFRPRENGVVAASAATEEGAEGEGAPASSRVVVPVHDCELFTKTREVEFTRLPFFARARGLDAAPPLAPLSAERGARAEEASVDDATRRWTATAKADTKTKAKTTVKERTVGITTQTSIDRLSLLAGMAERWRGPISCAVLLRAPRAARSSTSSSGSAPDVEAVNGGGGLSIALQKKRIQHFWNIHPAVKTFVDIHLLVADADDDTGPANEEKAGRASFRFPVNHLRNFALHHSRADFVLILDIDFLTSRRALPAINAQLATFGYPTNIAFVLPAFEPNPDVISTSTIFSSSDEGVDDGDAGDDADDVEAGEEGRRGNREYGSMRTMSERRLHGNRRRSAANALRRRRESAFDEGEEALPSDMRSAREMWDSQPSLLLPFHSRGYKRGHSFSNFSRWFDARRGFGIRYNEGMEPYVVVARSAVPYFQEVFWGYGLNKVSWHAELHCANYRYYTVPRVFIVHRPHAPDVSKGRKKRSSELKCNREQYSGPFKSYLAQQVCTESRLPAAARVCGLLPVCCT